VRNTVGSKTWVLFDQVLSSLGNFLVGLYAAHVLTPSEFGVFAIIQVCYLLALGVCRSLFTDVAMVSEARASPTWLHLGAVDCVYLVATLAAVTAGTILSLTSPNPVLPPLLAVVGVAVALAQDAVRMTAISIGRSRQAALSDGLWLLTLVIVLPTCYYLGWLSPWAIVAAWGLSSATGLISGAIQVKWRLSVARGISFVQQQHRLGTAFLGEWSIKQGTTQVAIYGIGLMGGIATVAGIRAAALVLGPLNILFTGLQLAALPSLVAKRDRSIVDMRYSVRCLALLLGGASLFAGIFLFVTPQTWLAILVGNQAEGFSQYVLPLAVSLAATGFMTGSHLGLRVLGAGRNLLTVRVVATVLTLAGGALGYLLGNSPLWGLWGLAVGGLLAVVPWELAFRQAYHAAEPRYGVVAR
jgi:O-antigen/teichoic acid export membrane protein